MRWLYDIEPMSLYGRPADSRTVELWAEDSQGRLAMEATVTLAADHAWGDLVAAAGAGPPRSRRLSAPRLVSDRDG